MRFCCFSLNWSNRIRNAIIARFVRFVSSKVSFLWPNIIFNLDLLTDNHTIFAYAVSFYILLSSIQVLKTFSILNRRHITFIFIVEYLEKSIDDTKVRVSNTVQIIKQQREEKKRLEEDARRLRAEADSACIRGSMQRELGLSNHQRLLNEGKIHDKHCLIRQMSF